MPANMILNPTANFVNRVTNLFNQMVQTFANQGQLTEPVRMFILNEYNINGNNIVSQIFNRLQQYGVMNREPTDNEIRVHLKNFVDQAMSNYAMQTRAQYAAPMYQPQAMMRPMTPYNPGLMTGVQPNQVSIFTPQFQQPQQNPNVYSAMPTQPTVPAQPQQPSTIQQSLNRAAEMAAQQQQPQQASQSDGSTEANNYQAPVLKDPNGIALNNEDANGTVFTYTDPLTERDMSYATVTLNRPMKSPKHAIDLVLGSLKGCLCADRYISITYPHVAAYDVKKDDLVKVIAELKEVTKGVPVNAKYTYLKNIKKVLGNYSNSIYETIETVLLNELNMVTVHGGLFDSTREANQCMVTIESIKDLIKYLDPEEGSTLPEELKAIPGFEERLSDVARRVIVKTIQTMVLSDPNTPEGMEDYLAVYGDIVVGGHRVSDIKMFKERSMRTDKEGEKTKEAMDAMEVYTSFFNEMMGVSIIKVQKQVVYTTLPILHMVRPDYLVSWMCQCIGGPVDQEVCHTEHFTTFTMGDEPVKAFYIYFQPVPNILMSFTGTKTTDGWFYLTPSRLG